MDGSVFFRGGNPQNPPRNSSPDLKRWCVPIVFGIVFERSLIILKHFLFSLASCGNFCYIPMHGAEPRYSGTPGYLPRHSRPHSFSRRSIPAAGTNVYLQRAMSNLELASTQRRLEGYGLQRTPSPFGPERSHSSACQKD